MTAGGLVAVLVAVGFGTRDQEGAVVVPVGYTVQDRSQLVLHVELGPSDEVVGAEVLDQSEQEVRVRVRVDRADQQPLVAVERTVTVTLDAPLGERAVLDENGQELALRP